MTASPVKILVNTGRSPRYYRYGYLREISNQAVILTTAAAEKFASASIPTASVEDMWDATAAEVEANANRKPLA